MTTEEIEMYERINRLINKKFEGRLHEEAIVEKVMDALHPFERTPEFEAAVKDVVYNRQLVEEKFR
jgi:hypothetical protein